MDAPVKCAAPACYQRRHPELTLWYRTVQAYFETWLALSKAQFDESPHEYEIQAFRRYLECGILAFGFARARCKNCGHDFLVAFWVKQLAIRLGCQRTAAKSLVILQGAWHLSILQHAQDGRDRSTSGRSRFPSIASTS